MIASINKTNQILDKYSLRAKKGFGQNFLIDGNIVLKICEKAKVDKETGVIEIGPGLGAMTEILVSKACKVLCYEIDFDMIKVLESEITVDNLKIIHQDFLKSDARNELKYFEGLKRIIVVSNLPYYITTPIIFKLLEIDEIDEIFIMVQKEVGERLSAKPGNKEYGSLSVLIKYLTECKEEFAVSRNCFSPVPNVDSEIVSMKRIKNDYKVNNEPNFKEFVQNIFFMKRKTLVNNIITKYRIKRETIELILQELNLSLTIRSESLSLENIILIYNKLMPNID